MNIYKKLSLAKLEVKSTRLTKEGLNSFSKYKYFTPEQVEEIVFKACNTNGLIYTFDLMRNEYGEYGVLTLIDIDTSEKIDFKIATAIPDIKAANIAQQLGGCVTYTERYLKMSIFGITENALDFDDKNNDNKVSKSKLIELTKSNTKLWNNCLKALMEGNTIDEIKEKVSMGKDVQEQLLSEAI